MNGCLSLTTPPPSLVISNEVNLVRRDFEILHGAAEGDDGPTSVIGLPDEIVGELGPIMVPPARRGAMQALCPADRDLILKPLLVLPPTADAQQGLRVLLLIVPVIMILAVLPAMMMILAVLPAILIKNRERS